MTQLIDKDIQVYDILMRDYERCDLAEWIVSLLPESKLDEIIAKESEGKKYNKTTLRHIAMEKNLSEADTQLIYEDFEGTSHVDMVDLIIKYAPADFVAEWLENIKLEKGIN